MERGIFLKYRFCLLLKVCLILLLILCTPFLSGLFSYLSQSSWVHEQFLYSPFQVKKPNDIQKHFNLLSYHPYLTIQSEDIHVETTRNTPMIVPKKKKRNKVNGKKIYIYNTHQSESYIGGNTVMDAAVVLSNHLKEKGYEVVLETNDFEQYCREHNLTYNDLYVVSNKYLNEALVHYGGFDLCIDLHRDSVPREYTYVTLDGKKYAKIMMVVGGSAKYVESVKKNSTTIINNVNKHKNGIMKNMMVRDIAYYNQEVCEGIILIECGSDHNTFDEVKRSLEYLAMGIDDFLREGN